jgi:hypothetical protein
VGGFPLAVTAQALKGNRVGLNGKTALFPGFGVQFPAIGDGHIKNPAAFFTMQMVVAIPPPVIPKNVRVGLNRGNLPVFFKGPEITVNRTETHRLIPGDPFKNFPRRQMIPVTDGRQNQLPLIRPAAVNFPLSSIKNHY